MSSGKRRLVRTMVFEAFNRFEDDAEARKDYLRERCCENPEFLPIALDEIEAEEKIRKGQFMDKPAAAVLCGVIPEGTLIGEYRIGKLIGEGAMGAVYRARQISLDRDVAVKTLRTPLATQAGQRFLAEAKTLSRIASARVIHVYGYGDHNGQPYIAMEYGEGTNLAQLIGTRRFPDIKSRLEVALQIAEGLEQIHLANVAHRDVKPSNVLVDARGNVKLIDFGIAWREDSRMTEIGQALGTPAYMPPEQILRHLGGSATDVEQYKLVDIYSFGILLYELFTGELPFKGETRGEVEREIVHTPVRLEPLRECQVPEGVVELIRLATSKNPAARPRSFSEVVNVLRIYIENPQARTVDRPAPAKSFRRPITVVGIVAALMIAAGVYQLRFGNSVHLPGSGPPINRATDTPPPMSSPAAATSPTTRLPPERNPSPVSDPVFRLEPERPTAGQQRAQDLPQRKQADDPVIPEPPAPIADSIASRTEVVPVKTPEAPGPVESAEDRDWIRVRDTSDAAALQAFRTLYPNGKYAAEARKAAAAIEYEAIKNSTNPEALQNFAQKYPEHPLAPSVMSMANQLKARAAASNDIRETLKRYAAAMHSKKLSEVESLREMSKKARAGIENTLGARSIEMTLVPIGPPQFAEPVAPDPAAMQNLPSSAVVDCELGMAVVSNSGDFQTDKQRVRVHLKRTAKGWIITSL